MSVNTTNGNSSQKEEIATPVATIQTLSKKQQKKLEKRQRWLEQKAQRKAKEKEKRKLKIQRARESGRDLGPSRKLLKTLKMSASSCKLKVCFDLSLSDLMTDGELSKTFKQLHRCYSINRRAEAPLQLYITGYSDKCKHLMSIRSGSFKWDVNFNHSRYSEIFEKDNIIYLTSDSPNEIDKLDLDKTYIIGALVDHNRLKNICYEKAQEAGVGHARLPLDSYFKFKTRRVLTIDQVYLILLRLTEGKSWIDAVVDTIPKRKGIELKPEAVQQEQNSSLDNLKENSLHEEQSSTLTSLTGDAVEQDENSSIENLIGEAIEEEQNSILDNLTKNAVKQGQNSSLDNLDVDAAMYSKNL